MGTRRQVQVAAWVASVMLLIAGIGQFAAVVHAALADDPPAAGAFVVAVLAGFLAVASAAVLLVRVGYWRGRVSAGFGRTWAPWVALAALGGAVAGFAGQMDAPWFVAGPMNLVIALLAWTVARSESPDQALVQ